MITNYNNYPLALYIDSSLNCVCVSLLNSTHTATAPTAPEALDSVKALIGDSKCETKEFVAESISDIQLLAGTWALQFSNETIKGKNTLKDCAWAFCYEQLFLQYKDCFTPKEQLAGIKQLGSHISDKAKIYREHMALEQKRAALAREQIAKFKQDQFERQQELQQWQPNS